MGGHRGATAHARLPFMNGGLERDWLRAAEDGYGSRSLFACPHPPLIYLFRRFVNGGQAVTAARVPRPLPGLKVTAAQGGGQRRPRPPRSCGHGAGWGQPCCPGCGPLRWYRTRTFFCSYIAACVSCWHHRYEKARKS